MDKQEGKGIWRFQKRLPLVPTKCHLTLGEGNTNLEKIDNTLFKCEFDNPTGSVKDRGMAYQISKLLEKGVKRAVISSSGNAAISAAYYCRLGRIDLTVFVIPKINKKKLSVLQKLNCHIIKTSKPISASIRYARENNVYNLRQSTDPSGATGYETLAYELQRQEPNIEAIFIPVSSGTTLVGLASGFQKLGKFPAIHVVQTERVSPIASLFDKDFIERKKSLADSIVAKYTPRQEEVVKIIKKSKGWGWVVSDTEMKKARNWLLIHRINCSYEGAATLAAFWKAQRSGYRYKYPVCLLTGKYY